MYNGKRVNKKYSTEFKICVIMNICEYEFDSSLEQYEKYFRYCSITHKTVKKIEKSGII